MVRFIGSLRGRRQLERAVMRTNARRPGGGRSSGALGGGLILLAVVAGGCVPDSFIITPISHKRGLIEEELAREAMFTQGKVAVIDVEGVILNSNEPGLLTPRENPLSLLLEQLDQARRDARVKAVVLRINSPGGAVTASELMHHEITRFRATTEKPVVAMMLDVAASGGYYIACAADEIIATRSTVTGSIGVIMLTFDATGTMNKIGLRADAIRSGDQKGAGSPFESMTPDQREVFQTMINEFYGQFVGVVTEGRKLDRTSVEALADGRVYTAPQALAHGLIDHIGTMNDAIAHAKERAGIRTATIVTYMRPYGLAPNYYARQPAPPATAQVNLLNIDLSERWRSGQAPFMYLWLP
jgi:protease-4